MVPILHTIISKVLTNYVNVLSCIFCFKDPMNIHYLFRYAIALTYNLLFCSYMFCIFYAKSYEGCDISDISLIPGSGPIFKKLYVIPEQYIFRRTSSFLNRLSLSIKKSTTAY